MNAPSSCASGRSLVCARDLVGIIDELQMREMGVEIALMNVDRRGGALEEEIEYPFSNIVLDSQIITQVAHEKAKK